MKKRVGILTFHDGINHGAFFQAYYLQNFLHSAGYDATIVNYKNRTHRLAELKSFFLTKRPMRLLRNIVKFRNFRRDHQLFKLDGPLKTRVDAIRQQDFDAYVIGSDIVWNYTFDWLGNDPIYYGHGLERPRISYAASCGPIDGGQIPEYVRTGFRNFSHISVRDRYAAELVDRCHDQPAVRVVDPTLLVNDIMPARASSTALSQPYLLVYATMLTAAEIAETRRFASEQGLKTVCVGYQHDWCDIDRTTVGPVQWLNWFEQASFIVTSTFHGTIFAIKFRKPFICSMNPAILNKVGSLVSDLGLEDRLSRDDFDRRKMLEAIDYDAVFARLEVQSSASRDFLKQSLAKLFE